MRALVSLCLSITSLALLASAACGGDEPATADPQGDSGAQDATPNVPDTSVDAADSSAPVCPTHGFQWATVSQGAGAQVDVRGITRDPAGNVWIVGFATGNATWGGFPLSTDTLGTVFVASLDPSGNVRSARALLPPGVGAPNRIKADAKGNVYVVGNFEGDVTLAPDAGLSSAESQVFLMKLDPTGAIVWARQSTGTGVTVPYGLAVDAAGDVAITGSYIGSTSFGSTAIPSSDKATVAYAAKYTESGDLVWARGWASQSAAGGNGVAANDDGTVVVAGYMSRRIDFDGYVVGTSVQSTTASFVIELDAAGRVRWAADLVAQNEQTDHAHLYAAATDPAGNVYVGGYAAGTIAVRSAVAASPDAGALDGGGAGAVDAGSPITIQAHPPQYDMLLARYDSNGHVVWARNAGAAGVAAEAVDIAANDSTGVFVLGSSYYGQPVFDALTPNHTGLVFLARYDAQGTARWVTGNDGDNDEITRGESRSLAVGAPGSGVFAAGSFTRKWKFGDIAVESDKTNGFDDRMGFVTRICE
jgi:hypothetical protein